MNRPNIRFKIIRIYANLGVTPIKNSTQLCPIHTTKVECLRSSYLVIECGGGESNKLSWANITFIGNSRNFSINVDFSSIPLYLDQSTKSTIIFMPHNKNKWLESLTDGLSTTYIIDYQTNVTLLFENTFSLTIYAPKIIVNNATGLVIDGCSFKNLINIG